jgi:polyisoprenoid-binding protein YceI
MLAIIKNKTFESMKLFSWLILFTIATNSAFPQNYIPTDTGSKIHFVIKNLGIKTGGDFGGLTGTIVFDPKALPNSCFNVSVKANTINTDNNARDKHLRNSEYFNTNKYPVISFVSTKVTESNLAGRFYITGNLTIKDVTKPIEFGFSAAPTSSGYFFEGEFYINRLDYGVGSSSIVLADNLKVSLSVFTKNKEPASIK